MKTITLSMLCLFPIALFAQRDYCPCMDKKEDNQYLDLMDVLNRGNNNMANLNMESSSLYTAQVQEQNQYYPPVQFTTQSIEQEPEQVIQTVDGSVDMPQQQLVQERVKLRTNSMSATFKKAKKRKSAKLKARKKAKKYKGDCPRF